MTLEKLKSCAIIFFLLNLMLSGCNGSAETDYLRINHPEDIVFTKGNINKTIDWFPESDHPLEWGISQNGIKIATGEWHSGNVSQSLSHLEVGNYTFYLEIKSDAIWGPPNTTAVYCLLATDTVYVTILEQGSILSSIPETIWIVLITIGLVSVVLLVAKKQQRLYY